MINLSHSANRSVENHLRIVLFLALVLRLFGLTAFSLSNDELSALSRLQFDSFESLIHKGVYPDFHPAGVHVFLYMWTAVFGFSEWVIRLPFALMGALSVYVLYRIGRAWFGESTGLLASGALAVLIFPLLYSQIARPYSPGLLCSLSSVFFLTRFLGFEKDVHGNQISKGKLMDGLLFVVSVSCCMYIHYFSFLFAGLVCFCGLFFIHRSMFVKYLACGLAILLLYLPAFDLFTYQLSKGGLGGPDGWLSAPTPEAFGKYLDYVFNDSSHLKLIFFVAFTGVVLVYRGKVVFGKWHILSLILFLVPFAVAYFYSIWINPVFQYSILLFSTPFFLMFLFSFFPANRYGITAKVVFFIILFSGFYSTVYEKSYYQKKHFTEFRSVAQSIKTTITEHGRDSVTITANVHSPFYLNFYLPPEMQMDSGDVTRVIDEKERLAFTNKVIASKSPYLIYAYSNIYSPPERDVFIRNYFPDLLAIDTFMNSGFRLYAKSGHGNPKQSFADLTYVADLTIGDYRSRFDSLTSSVSFGSLDEFGPSIVVEASKAGLQSGNVVEGKAIILNADSLQGVQLVLSIEHDNQKYYYKAMDADVFANTLGQAVSVPLVVELVDSIPPEAELKLYVWNQGKRVFKLVSLELKIYRSRPNTFFPPM